MTKVEEVKKKVGDKIRKTREKKKLTQAQFSKRIEVSQGRLSDWERGVDVPSIQHMLSLKEKFGIKIISI